MAAYLDGALPEPDRARLEVHLAAARTAASTSPRSGSSSTSRVRSPPTLLDDEALDELVDLYRVWRSG